ncbi:MAG: malto-oligosyltrehalose trehalohydrolase [Spirochaetaceae bacterium]
MSSEGVSVGEKGFPLQLTFGPETDDRGTVFRLWAPSARRVELVIHRAAPPPAAADSLEEGTLLELPRDREGWCSSERLPLGAGSRYRFRIDGDLEVPDPASRFQPEGVHGPSEVVDLRTLPGVEGPRILGRPWEETVLYELHPGTFTHQGGYAGITDRLDYLVDLGVTAVELMPLSAFPGERNWGYDGVLPYAPAAPYGSPEELATLIRSAHERGIQLILDVVYNHFGPDGNYLHLYADPFFTDRFTTPWGAAIDFATPEVRRFFLENALYWTLLYGFDGLRVDAVHAIRDDSREHFVDEMARRVKSTARRGNPERNLHIVLENEENEAYRLQNSTAQWNDDVHHLIHVLLTGETEGYYCDYQEEPHLSLARTLAEGFYFQGEPSIHRNGRPRGTPSRALSPTFLVAFTHNHDQIGNRALGERPTVLAATGEALEAAEALVLLSPQTPMLFMGEEWGSEKPFLFFCDYHGELAEAVREGRRREFAAFRAFEDEASRRLIPDPNAPETFESSRLDWEWLEGGDGASGQLARHALLRRLLTLRRERLTPYLPAVRSGTYEGAAEEAVRVRWPLGPGRYWTLYVNLTDSERSLPRFRSPRRCDVLYPEGTEESALSPGAGVAPWSVIAAFEEE